MVTSSSEFSALLSTVEKALPAGRELPASLEDALDELEKDQAFLTEGDVFTEDVIAMWLEYKREAEVDEIRQRPHPYEFALYFDI